SALLLVASGVAIRYAGALLPEPGQRRPALPVAVLAAAACLAAAFAIDLHALTSTDLSPTADSFAALTYLAVGLQGGLVLLLTLAAAFVIARYAKGLLDGERRLSYQTTRLLWMYAVVQGLAGLLLIHGFPRLVGGGA